jgi:hypothetical protein
LPLPLFQSRAVGVGQNEHPVPDVRGINGGSRYAMPFCIKPDRGQRPENSVQPSSKQPCHVLQHNRSRSQFANHAKGFKKQSASLSVQSCPSAGVGNVLTGEASADNIDSLKVVLSALSDIAFSVDAWPMLGENPGCVIIDFYLPFANHAGTFKA